MEEEQKEYQKYICNKCNYRFTLKTDSNVTLRCPYCSGDNLTEDNFNVDDVIKEVNDMR